jgi:endoglucanase
LKRIGLSILIFLFAKVSSAQPSEEIKLNQVGYYPKGEKIAVLTGNHDEEWFYVVSSARQDTVFKGKLGEERKSKYSSTLTRKINFSSIQKPGTYFIYIPTVGNSYSFTVANNVYHNVATEVLKGYYFMRSDIPLQEQYAGKWKHPAGHPDTIVYVHASAASKERPEGTVISTPGGWYDAGDYNKYIVNSGITMGTLLSAYEDFPNYFNKFKTNIPESNDAILDILNEVLYNLRWMLTMQDPNDGGVYHKCTNAAFEGFVMPGITKAPRYVVQKSTGAALDFAAVMAQASRVLKKFQKQLPHLSDSCLKAAIKAWQWAEKNSSVFYNQRENNQKFQPAVTTGEYGDRSFKDEWFWSAAELYVTTKDKNYFSVVENGMKDSVNLPSWANVAMLGYYSFIRNEKNLAEAKTTIDRMEKIILSIADEYLLRQPLNAFNTIMGQTVRDFSWGGNSVAANQGILLINAYFISSNKKYIGAAMSNVDYLLGRNATGYCFVTDVGSKSPMHPHHRPSESDGIPDPVPGLLVGGPNPGMQDKCHYSFNEPETAYTDDVCAYACNEIAINWNAPAVYLFNAIEALSKK